MAHLPASWYFFSHSSFLFLTVCDSFSRQVRSINRVAVSRLLIPVRLHGLAFCCICISHFPVPVDMHTTCVALLYAYTFQWCRDCFIFSTASPLVRGRALKCISALPSYGDVHHFAINACIYLAISRLFILRLSFTHFLDIDTFCDCLWYYLTAALSAFT